MRQRKQVKGLKEQRKKKNILFHSCEKRERERETTTRVQWCVFSFEMKLRKIDHTRSLVHLFTLALHFGTINCRQTINCTQRSKVQTRMLREKAKKRHKRERERKCLVTLTTMTAVMQVNASLEMPRK